MINYHKSVLATEVLKHLEIKPDGIYIDCTLDGGGHSESILTKLSDKGILVGIDMDPIMIEHSQQRLAKFGDKAILAHSNFSDLDYVLEESGIEKVDGILADLGLSSNQLDRRERGFSFQSDGPIDMRFDTDQKQTAADLIAELDEQKLAFIIKRYGEERFAKKIAKELKKRIQENTLTNTSQLAEAVSDAVPRSKHPKKIHVATRTFQALRIAVNEELENLEQMLPKALLSLKAKGRLAIITYHSLEERIVKGFVKEWEIDCICPPGLPVCGCGKKQLAKRVVKKPIRPSDTEIGENPRARSARLWVVERSST